MTIKKTIQMLDYLIDTLTVTKYRLNLLVALQKITIKMITSYRNYTKELENQLIRQ